MRLLIKNAQIIFPGHKYHQKQKDILIHNGEILKIAASIKDDKAKVIKEKGLMVTPGWTDIGSTGGEPGYEYRENFRTLSATAAAGGYTAVAIWPNTSPPVDDKASVQFIINNSASQIVDVYPVGAISKMCAGEEITEMIDMERSGAIAFSDGQKSVRSNGLLLRAFQYVKSVNGLIIHHPDDPALSEGNNIHEGEVSINLGLKGSPAIGEVLMLQRDALLADYADSRYLAHNISTAESVDALKKLKSNTLSASVSYLNLCHTDEVLSSFNVQYKVNPPIRSTEDRKALIKAIQKGIIDVICSNHTPLEEEQKKKEFVYAGAGAIGLQTVYPALRKYADELDVSSLVNCLSINPRRILGLPAIEIKEGAPANLTLLQEDARWVFDVNTNLSRSKNSPYLGYEFDHKVVGIVNGDKVHINKY